MRSKIEDADRRLGHPVTQTADPIDRVVRLAPKWTVFVLLSCGLLVAGIIVWAVGGTVTSSVSTRGLFNEGGAAAVSTSTPATVDRVLVSIGQEVFKGQQLVSLTGAGPLLSPRDGVVTTILVSDGSVLLSGQTALRVTDLAEPDCVMTLVPASLTGTVIVGLPVRMEVSSAPSSTYGYLIGSIGEISSEPLTVAQFATKLGLEEQVVAAQLGDEPGLLAVINLEHDPIAASHNRWSIGQGPPFVITQSVPVTAQIILSEQSPIDLVFPAMDG